MSGEAKDVGWARLIAWLGSHWILVETDPDRVSFDRDGREIVVERAEAYGETWVTLTTGVPAGVLDATDALAHNRRGLVTVAIEEEAWVLRHTTTLRTLTPGHLERLIDMLAADSNELTALHLGGQLAVGNLFGNWIE